MFSSSSHSFVWDEDYRCQIEGAAARVKKGAAGDKASNARLAKENYHLISKARGYVDTSGSEHSLDLPKGAINKIYKAPKATGGQPLAFRHEQTHVTVAKADTATALRCLTLLGYKRVCALNFANAYHPGGGYLNGARAQEEDLCRLIPTLYTSLKKLRYPMKEWEAYYTQGLLARESGSYALERAPLLVNVVSSAMPDLGSYHNKLCAGSDEWRASVRLRLRATLHAAREEKVDALILGAFGCGAFGNPPELVAPLMVEALQSAEFRGSFACVAFAILVNRDGESSNVRAFLDACKPGAGFCEPMPVAASSDVAESGGGAATSGSDSGGGGGESGGAGGSGSSGGATLGSCAAQPMDVS